MPTEDKYGYIRKYCPACGKITWHEGGVCTKCGRLPLTGLVKRLQGRRKK
jgi:uncharacterized OB-fold protein